MNPTKIKNQYVKELFYSQFYSVFQIYKILNSNIFKPVFTFIQIILFPEKIH